MATIRAFTMPKWGIEMTEGTLAEWMVKEGAAFSRGDTLCLIETDKITNDVDAEFDSVLRKVIAPMGEHEVVQNAAVEVGEQAIALTTRL